MNLIKGITSRAINNDSNFANAKSNEKLILMPSNEGSLDTGVWINQKGERVCTANSLNGKLITIIKGRRFYEKQKNKNLSEKEIIKYLKLKNS